MKKTFDSKTKETYPSFTVQPVTKFNDLFF